MREVDNDFAMIGNEYGDVAAKRTDARIDRDKAFADAYNAAEGNSTDRRQAAVAAVGRMGAAEEIAYAKVAADFELRHARSIHLASLLKRANDDDPRYRT